MADEEEVVGVLKRCAICEARTVHVDGVCRSHRVIRRRKARPRAAAPVAPPPAPPPKRTSWVRRVISVLVIGALVYGFGAVHVVHGDHTGLRACWKTGWTFADTLVDSDAVAAHQVTNRAVLDALAKCDLP